MSGFKSRQKATEKINMKKIYRLLSWALSVAVVFCVLLFGWRVLQNQSKETSSNPYEYNIERYRVVDPALIHFVESESIKINAKKLHAMATDKDGNIFVSADLNLLKFNNAGELLKSTALAKPCYCIEIADDGKIYLGMSNHIIVCDESLAITDTWADLGENARLTSLTLLNTFLYAADSGQRIVWKLGLDGKMAGQIGQSSTESNHYIVPSPYFDVVAAGGSLWVANPGRAQVEQIDTNEKIIDKWGEASMDIAGFPGCCNPSHIAKTRDDLIVTAEKGMPRVKIYDKNGKLASVVAGPKSFEKTPPGCYTEAIIKDLAVDSKGRVLVLDRSTGSIRIFTRKEN
jgi:sugar lactone lactonase YvrE